MIFAVGLTIVMSASLFFILQYTQRPQVEVMSREGVVSKIQSLNRLQTVAYHVDTVIQSRKEGNWYTLWQDEQKGLFIAHGRVLAGIDLHQLKPEHVQFSKDHRQVEITLPPAQVFETYLDRIEVYDVKTGLFNLLDVDPDIFNQAQTEGKKQVLLSACKTNILQAATENAQKQVQALFQLVNVNATIKISATTACQS